VSEIRPDTLITHTVRIPQMVVRLVGKNRDQAKDRLTKTQVFFVDSLDDAAAQAVALVKALSKTV
jgi:succinyl-CoA synthetase beta subunit